MISIILAGHMPPLSYLP